MRAPGLYRETCACRDWGSDSGGVNDGMGTGSVGADSSGTIGGTDIGGGGGGGVNDGLGTGDVGRDSLGTIGGTPSEGWGGYSANEGTTGGSGLLGAIFDAIFGGPRTGDPVADLAITGWLSTIPLAGPLMSLTNAARDRGYSVEAADLPSSPSAGYDGYQTYSPYRPSTTNPFAALATPQADASWLPQGGANLTPYMLPQGAQTAQAAGSGANATVDPYEAAEKPSWPLLLVAAGVLAGLTL